MWPLHVFVNKLLKLEEGRENGPDKDDPSLSDTCLLNFSSMNILDLDVLLPSSRFIEIPHVNQLYNWDCGLACVLMVLQTMGIRNCSLQSLENLCGTKSIWTVDLAYLLQRFSFVFSYFTVTLGANPNFSLESFYKDQLPHDLVRVNLLFQKALEAGIKIKCRSFSREEVSLLILSGRYIAIALVDQNKLRMSCISSQSWLGDDTAFDFKGDNMDYTGHFIVICGYDSLTDVFEIRDPADSRKNVRVPSKCLDEARKSFGTDEDLLLISLEQKYNKETLGIQLAKHVDEKNSSHFGL